MVPNFSNRSRQGPARCILDRLAPRSYMVPLPTQLLFVLERVLRERHVEEAVSTRITEAPGSGNG
jgi:hypothetical protein